MAVNNAKELFIKMLSDVRQRTEKTTKIYEELSELAQEENIKEALQSRAFLQGKDLTSLDRCFELIGEKPVALNERLHDVFVEDFKRELAEMNQMIVVHLPVRGAVLDHGGYDGPVPGDDAAHLEGREEQWLLQGRGPRNEWIGRAGT